jgi:hypothetical protein
MIEFLVMLSRKDRITAPTVKPLWFNDLDEARDAAIRKLRLSRNVSPDYRYPYDQWTVAQKHGPTGFRILATGGIETL